MDKVLFDKAKSISDKIEGINNALGHIEFNTGGIMHSTDPKLIIECHNGRKHFEFTSEMAEEFIDLIKCKLLDKRNQLQLEFDNL
ncbi:hypothetical protein GOQ04_03250 [Emticicia sp. ODNR4P]|nr:hypothetical protein [Emticicia sp. ODNR4P]